MLEPELLASSRTAGSKPWSRSTTGSRLNERSRSAPIVARCRSSAVPMIPRRVEASPSSIECKAASSISAIPDSDWTGVSWR